MGTSLESIVAAGSAMQLAYHLADIPVHAAPAEHQAR
jgi:hypothetical protein